MMRVVLLIGPALIMMSCAAALAQDPVAAPLVMPTTAMPSFSAPPAAAMTNAQDYLMALGPFGALVWGAFLLGRGIKLTLNVKLDDVDRKLIERGVEALEKKA